jgi:DNA-binding NarL/FixJ family response regulator
MNEGSEKATPATMQLAVVDDRVFDREAATTILRGHFGSDAEVIEFANAEDLLSWSGSPFDLVVLDLQLRGGTLQGDDAVRAVAQRYRVLVLSGVVSGEMLERAHAAGAMGYVSKDTSGSQALVDGVKAALDGRPYVDPELQAKIGQDARRRLTAHQQEVLRQEALGCTDAQIALDLKIKPGSVRGHIERILEIYPRYAKPDRVRLAIELGLVTPWEASRRYPSPPS